MQSAWGKWAPPLERSQLVSLSFSGSSFGTFITLPIAGIIADNMGWEAVYYFTGWPIALSDLIIIDIERKLNSKTIVSCHLLSSLYDQR